MSPAREAWNSRAGPPVLPQTMPRPKALKLTVMASVIAALFVGCGGASSSSSSRSDGVNRCYPRGHTGAATYDEAREASHQSNTGDPARPVAYGTRAGAETPPEWWGRGEVDPCADEERPNLSGPLLLDDDAPGADEPEAPETEPLDPER